MKLFTSLLFILLSFSFISQKKGTLKVVKSKPDTVPVITAPQLNNSVNYQAYFHTGAAYQGLTNFSNSYTSAFALNVGATHVINRYYIKTLLKGSYSQFQGFELIQAINFSHRRLIFKTKFKLGIEASNLSSMDGKHLQYIGPELNYRINRLFELSLITLKNLNFIQSNRSLIFSFGITYNKHYWRKISWRGRVVGTPSF